THAVVLRCGLDGGYLSSVAPHAVRRQPGSLAAAAGAVRVGGTARPPRAPGDDVLRRGVTVGEGRPALPERISVVGRATLGSRQRDLHLHGPRAAGAGRPSRLG